MQEQFKDRLASAMKNAKVGRTELARACGISHSTVWAWLSGRVKNVSATSLQAAAVKLGVSAQWLATGQSEKDGTIPQDNRLPPGIVVVPVFRIEIAADGSLFFEKMHDECPFVCPESLLRNADSENCKAFIMRGADMAPSISDGDLVLVDCSPQEITAGYVYVFRYHGKILVRRLFPMANGGLFAKRDDSTIPGEELQAPGDSSLIGRVIARSGSERL